MIKRRDIGVFTLCCCLSAFVINSCVNYFTVSASDLNKDRNIKVSEDISGCDTDYIIKCESKDAAEIEDKLLKESRAAKFKDMLNDDGSIDYKKFFNNTVFLGDSITEFLSAADILPQKNVYAMKGRTVITAAQEADNIAYENPERIIVLFGMNDVVNFSESKDFKEKYIELINKLKEKVPEAVIYIESPTPIRSSSERPATGFTNKKLDEFRQKAMEAAEETGCTYVDITGIATEDNFEADGIHFKYNFYKTLFAELEETISSKEK